MRRHRRSIDTEDVLVERGWGYKRRVHLYSRWKVEIRPVSVLPATAWAGPVALMYGPEGQTCSKRREEYQIEGIEANLRLY